MTFVIFYSWQSDLPNATNRGFIGTALDNASKALRRDDTITVEPVIDRDTAGVPGSPDIALTIFSKIDQCQLFVCDVSVINPTANSRATPNPNVLVELGYALRSLGPERVVLVMNTAHGEPERLPFDLRMRRIIVYNMPAEGEDRSTERKALEQRLEDAVRAVIGHHERTRISPASSEEPTLLEQVGTAIRARSPRQAILMRQFMEETTAGLVAIAPDFAAAERDGIPLDDTLIAALDRTISSVEGFTKVAQSVAEEDAEVAAEAMYQGFGGLLDRYQVPQGFSGTYWPVDFDFFKFLGHELFVTLIAFLIDQNRWQLIGRLLEDTIYVHQTSRGGAGTKPITDISEHLSLLEDRNRRLKLSRVSVHADLLHQRHTQGPLASLMPERIFQDADYFLFLRATLSSAEDPEWLDWRAWSALYLADRTPKFLLTADRRSRAAEIAQALSLPDVDLFRTRLEERGQRIAKLFPGYHRLNPLARFEITRLGSRG